MLPPQQQQQQQHRQQQQRTTPPFKKMRKRPLNPKTSPKFHRIANLITPWLTPKEVSSLSQTCHTLSHLCHQTTSIRSLDASNSLESRPVPFVNPLDSHPYAFFLYSPTCIPPPPPPRQHWGPAHNPICRPTHFFGGIIGGIIEGIGCDCKGIACGDGCQCRRVYAGEVITECGVGCRCGFACGNRVSGNGVAVELKIVRVKNKGWGLFANHFVSSGTFVCEYAGELLTTQEARRRQQLYDELAKSGQFCSALLVVREHLPSRKACFRINIDASTIGNVARFINHSCDGGNLNTVLVRSSGSIMPRVCFFTSRDVQAGEELCFSYGDVRLRPQGLPCSCGSPGCFGTLPSEHT